MALPINSIKNLRKKYNSAHVLGKQTKGAFLNSCYIASITLIAKPHKYTKIYRAISMNRDVKSFIAATTEARVPY